MMAKTVKLLFTTSRVGSGTTENPVRLIYELWTEDGHLVVSIDSHTLGAEGNIGAMRKLMA